MSEQQFSDWLEDIEKDAKPWQPGWYYNKYGNCAHIIWKEPKRGETAEYVNNAITLMRDDETNEVIGVMIKNVTQVLEGKDCNDFHRGD